MSIRPYMTLFCRYLRTAARHGFSHAVFAKTNEFVNGRIPVDGHLLAIINAHRRMRRFLPGEEGQILVGQGQMLRDKSKNSACQCQRMILRYQQTEYIVTSKLQEYGFDSLFLLELALFDGIQVVFRDGMEI